MMSIGKLVAAVAAIAFFVSLTGCAPLSGGTAVGMEKDNPFSSYYFPSDD